jgi:signal transduction histidine kinase/FixJ family two-component response regulator
MKKDGTISHIESQGSVIRAKDGKITNVVVVSRDVTEKKQLEQQFMRMQRMESIGTLAGGIAHDFNNLLGIILGHTSLLEHAQKDPALFASNVGAIINAVQRGANLVRQILIFARKTDVALEPVNVNATISELSKMLAETFPRTIDISLQLDKTAPVIMMDHTQLHQALLNLCVNARDAMTDPSPTKLCHGTLAIRTEAIDGSQLRERFADTVASEYVCISVSDTGMGMDEAAKQKIFEPFFTKKEVGRGTGLGLSVVYGIVKAHQGHIEVESEIGCGSSFKLYFPVLKTAVGPVERAKAERVEIQGGTETILVVEDEEGLRDLVKSMLEEKGYQVLTAMDGVEAIRQYIDYKQKIALVLADLGLPKLDGAAVFSALKDINPSVRAILVSGYLEPHLKSELLKSGAKDFIQKPYVPEEVLGKIREVLDNAIEIAPPNSRCESNVMLVKLSNKSESRG